MQISAFSSQLTAKLGSFSKPLLYKLMEIQKVANNIDIIKADKVDNPTVDNIAILDADGNIKDSGKDISDIPDSLDDLSGSSDDIAEGSFNLYFPGFTSLLADYGFTDNHANWDIAYGWGDHAGAGYSKSDGSADYTNIVGYSSHPAFIADTDIIDKKYVDDAISAAGGYTDEMAQDAVGGILTDSTEIDFTYDDGAGTITASLINNSIDESKLDASVNASLDLADSALQSESDPVFSAWDKSTGISITESQISDLGSYIESESDPLAVLKATFTADSQVLVGTGSGTYQAESGATLRTSLGLGTGDSPTFTALGLGTGELTTGSINRASGSLTLEIGGTARETITADHVDFLEPITWLAPAGSYALSSNGQAVIGPFSTDYGLMLRGKGAIEDVAITNYTGAIALGVLAGTNNIKVEGRLGIGTSPASPLHILTTSEYPLQINNSTNSNGIVIRSEASEVNIMGFYGAYNDLVLRGSSSDTLRLTTSNTAVFGGNVGIGISPSYPLHVSGNAYFTADVSALTITAGNLTTNGIKINAATDWFGSASVPDAPALTSNDFDDQTTGTASTSYILRQFDGDWEDVDDNFSTVATEFNKLRADVSDMRLQLNDLLAQLRITGGCGVIDD